MKQLRFLFALPMLFVLGCSSETGGDPASALISDSPPALHKDVPFKAALQGVGTPPAPSPLCDDLLLTELSVHGTATHLGLLTGSQSHCLNPATGAFSNGNFNYTAANGDHLLGTYSGFLVPTPDPTIFEITGSFDIVGGTGRFANATGSGTPTGSVQVTTGDFVLNLGGSISY